MVLDNVFIDEIVNIIKSLKEGSSGWDGICCSIIKSTYTAFIEPLTHVFNLSLTQGVFPNELKVARVVPLFKSGNAMIFSNYRPVSVLPVFSKILERLMYSRLLSFVTKYEILYSYQFGFRSNHSPNLALLLLVDKISDALEKGDYVLGLFLDFSKAFDTVNHQILFQKLEFYGVRGPALTLFKNYLCNREQYVEYNGVQSRKMCIKCGVPQGSILGPLLFLIYINDLARVSKKIFSLLFADDSNMFLLGKNPNDLIKSMNDEITHVVDWLRVNKLSLNLKKTHFIIFRKQRSKISLTEDLIIDGVKIDVKECTKFLGVMIDKCLTFKNHISYIKGKVSRGLGILYKCKRYFNQETLLMLYNSFIYPYLNYCVTVWGNTFESYLLPLIKLQKRAVRIISGAKRCAPSDPIFKKFRILKLDQIYRYSVHLFVLKFRYNLLPKIFDNFFTRNDEVHSHDTRSKQSFRTPFLRLDIGKRSVRANGVRIFNYISQYVTLNDDAEYPITNIKMSLKSYIIDNSLSLSCM